MSSMQLMSEVKSPVGLLPNIGLPSKSRASVADGAVKENPVFNLFYKGKIPNSVATE